MPWRDAAGMHRSPTIKRSLRRLDGRAGFAATFLAAATLTAAFVPPPPAPPSKQLVRWTAEGHDWLLVADREHDRIQAYDARDGRPLGTLDRHSGLADVDAMVLQGNRLVVLGRAGTATVRLPELRLQPSSGRPL